MPKKNPMQKKSIIHKIMKKKIMDTTIKRMIIIHPNTIKERSYCACKRKSCSCVTMHKIDHLKNIQFPVLGSTPFQTFPVGPDSGEYIECTKELCPLIDESDFRAQLFKDVATITLYRLKVLQ